MLASDDGFSGVVIVVGRFMSQIFFENGLLVAQAGAKACQGGAFRLHQRTFGCGVSCGNPRVHGRSGVYERRLLRQGDVRRRCGS